MINIDYALHVYTDTLNSHGSIIDLGYFKCNLSTEDYKEFIELIPFIKLFKSVKVTEKFDEVFERINTYKEELYSLPSVANFRTEKDAAYEEAKKVIDKIFDEEFDDE